MLFITKFLSYLLLLKESYSIVSDIRSKPKRRSLIALKPKNEGDAIWSENVDDVLDSSSSYILDESITAQIRPIIENSRV